MLQAAGIDGVTLANNHVLDYGPAALRDCLQLLDRAGIKRAGAGRDLVEASAAACFDTPLGRLAVVALTDNMRAWAATPHRPGVNYVAYDSEGLLAPYRSRLRRVLAEAHQQAKFVIVSAHVGPNWGPPSRAMRALARQLIDFGADMYWGHSSHTPLGMEIYRAKPILYAAGDFIDDYAVDPLERNDLSFLWVIELAPQQVQRIVLHPVKIEHCRVQRLAGSDAHWLMERMHAQAAALGSSIELHEQFAVLRLP